MYLLIYKYLVLSAHYDIDRLFKKGFPIVTVKNIGETAEEAKANNLKIGAIVTAVNGNSVEGMPLTAITKTISAVESRPVYIKFRDPSLFFELLDSSAGKPLRVITTQYLPANTKYAGSPEQIIKVERLFLPPPEERIRAAQMLDVMEIQYAAQIEGDKSGNVVDASYKAFGAAVVPAQVALRAVGGRQEQSGKKRPTSMLVRSTFMEADV